MIKLKKGVFLFDGKGGGHVMIQASQIAATYDVDDTQQGKFCMILVKQSQTYLRVMCKAKEIFDRLTTDLKPVAIPEPTDGSSEESRERGDG